MRLIDANELKIELNTDESSFCYIKAGNIYKTLVTWIKDATTIDAIPTEWIKKWSMQNQSMNYGNGRNAIIKLFNDWEKECRLKDTKDILDELLAEHNFKSYNDYVEYAGKITALPRDDRLDILFKEKENE